MLQLKQRFGEGLELCSGARGEERFATVAHADFFISLVHETLVALTPWDTSCVVPERLYSFRDGTPHLACPGDAAEDLREVQRMNDFLHPSCFERLARAARLDSSATRLAIPRWACSKGDDDEVERHPPSPLEGHEQEALLSELKPIRAGGPGQRSRTDGRLSR